MKFDYLPISSVATIISGGTPKTSMSEYWNGNIPWLSVKDFNNGSKFVYSTEKHITELGLKNSSTNLLRADDIIISARGTVGEMAMIPFDMAFNQSCFGIRANIEKILPDYLYYALKNNIQTIKSSTHGSVFDTITLKDFEVIKIPVPDLKTQKKIVRILSALDRKIELNNETNSTLEEIAKKLYDCFIQTLDEASSRTVALGDVAECKLGGTPSRAKPEYWGGDINWLNSGAVNSFRITEPSELITEEGLKHTSTYILPKGTTVLAITGATLGQVSRLEIEGCANQSVIGILGNNAISNEYIYLTIMEKIKAIISRQTGGAQQHINKNDVKEFKIILPNQQNMDSFTNQVKPLFEKISVNCFNNKILTELRNSLLPKLMSGEINLDKVEI